MEQTNPQQSFRVVAIHLSCHSLIDHNARLRLQYVRIANSGGLWNNQEAMYMSQLVEMDGKQEFPTTHCHQPTDGIKAFKRQVMPPYMAACSLHLHTCSAGDRVWPTGLVARELSSQPRW